MIKWNVSSLFSSQAVFCNRLFVFSPGHTDLGHVVECVYSFLFVHMSILSMFTTSVNSYVHIQEQRLRYCDTSRTARGE